MNQIQIDLDGPGKGKVYVDGVELPGVVRIDMSAERGRTEVKLTFFPSHLLVTADEVDIEKKELRL